MKHINNDEIVSQSVTEPKYVIANIVSNISDALFDTPPWIAIPAGVINETEQTISR